MDSLYWTEGRPRAQPRGIALPPIGQGLALISLVVVISIFTLLGIGAYISSLRVAQARSELANVNARIASAQSDVDGLQRNYAIRSRMLQLDRWGRQFDLEPVGLAQTAHDRAGLLTLAKARRLAMVTEAEDARPVDVAPGHGYTARARDELNDLIGGLAVER